MSEERGESHEGNSKQRARNRTEEKTEAAGLDYLLLNLDEASYSHTLLSHNTAPSAPARKGWLECIPCHIIVLQSYRSRWP